MKLKRVAILLLIVSRSVALFAKEETKPAAPDAAPLAKKFSKPGGIAH